MYLRYHTRLLLKMNIPAVSATRLLSLTAACFLFAISCTKQPDPKPEPEPDTEQSTAGDNNVAEMVAADIESIGAQVAENSVLVTYKTAEAGALQMAPCATVVLNPSNKTFTVDFGSVCLCRDGRVRSGKLFYNFAGSAVNANYYRNPGFKMTVAAQNYVVDGHQVAINKKQVLNTTPQNIPSGYYPGINLTWSVTANIVVTKPDNGGTVSWQCDRTKELVNTADSSCYRGQNNYIVWPRARVMWNGSASGTNASKEGFTSLATGLLRDFSCNPYPQHPNRHPFIAGTLTYKPGSRPARIIDFGNGSCDLNATVQINNVTYTISLP